MTACPKITEEEVKSSIGKLRQAGHNPATAGRDVVSSVCRVSQSRARKLIRKIREAGILPESGGEQHQVSGDTWQVSLPRTRICTLEQLIEHCQVDTQVWKCERFQANKWEVGASDGSGNIIVEPLFQVKAWFHKNVTVVSAREEIQEMLKDAAGKMPRYPKITRPKKQSGILLEVGIYDHHFGKLSWSPETGWGDYDLKIAEGLYFEALEALIARVSAYLFDKILFVIGNDLFNFDNVQGTTTSGIPQSCDSRYHKVFGVVRRANVAAIERLREIAPVRVVVVPGNHDRLSAFHVGDSLECWFRNCPDVEIDNTPRARKYFEWGKVLLMFTHGDKGKMKDMPLTMASEAGAAWGRTQYREIHTGDKHRARLEEHKGIRVRVLPCLTETDAWHAEMGFVGNVRSSEAYVWSREEGHIGTAMFNLPNVSSIAEVAA